MSQILKSQAQQAYKQFVRLNQSNKLPPKVALKLKYLSESFVDKKLNSNINFNDVFISEQQKLSLDEIPIQIKYKMFIQIVNSLQIQSQKKINVKQKSQPKYIRQNQLSYIRKNSKQSQWVKCLITLSTQTILIINNKTQQRLKQFNLSELKVLPQSSKVKKKYQLTFQYKQNTILIGFDYENIAQKVLQQIKQIKNAFERNKTQKKNKIKKIKKQINIKKIQQQQKQMAQKTKQNRLNLRMVNFVLKFIQKYKNDYKLVQTVQNNRILINTMNEHAKFKLTFLLQNHKPQMIIQSYLNFKEWNENIQSFQIEVNQKQNNPNSPLNTIKIHLKYKKKSFFMLKMFQSIKDFKLIVNTFQYNGKYYIVLKEKFNHQEDDLDITQQQNQNDQEDQFLGKFCQIVEIVPNKNLSKRNNDSIFLVSIYTQHCSTPTNDNKANDQKFILDQMKQVGKNFFNYAQIHSLSFNNQYKSQDMLFPRINSTKLEPNPQTSSNSQNSKILSSEQDQENLSVSSFIDSQDEEYFDQMEQKNQINTSRLYDLNKQMNQTNMKGSKDHLNQKQSILDRKRQKYQIQKYILMDFRGKPQQRLINLITQKKQHEKYYLKHKFVQKVQKLQPNRLQYDLINNSQTDDYVFQNGRFKMNQKKELYFADQQAIQASKDIIIDVIKKAGKALLSGQSVMNMPVPVELSEPRSMTERIAMSVCLFTKYIQRTIQTNNQIQQMKIITEMVVAFPVMFVNVEKAFNPILGQTLEVKIGGIPFYFEQISHHPPITAMYSKTDQFQFYGNFQSHLSIGLNNAVGKLLTYLTLKINNTKSQFILKLYDIEVGGLVYGDRTIRPYNICYIYEKNKGLYSEVAVGKKFSKGKPYLNKGQVEQYQLNGGFYKVNQKFLKMFNKTKVTKFQGIYKQYVVEQFGRLTGTWHDEVFIDNRKVRSRYDPVPNKIQLLSVVLPSDSNLRPDILYWRMKMSKASNKQKQVLENIQRRDKKLRLGKIKPNCQN